MDSRGSIVDLALVPIVLVALLVVGLPMWTVLHELGVETNSSGSTIFDERYINDGKKALEVFDVMVLFIILSVILGAAYLASKIPTSPVFTVPVLIVLAIFVLVAVQMGNVGYELLTASNLGNATAHYTSSARAVNNLPLIVLVGGFIIGVAMFFRPRKDEVTYV